MTTTNILRAFRANIKLGFDQEGNWIHPALYVIFALITPIAGVMMFVFMYLVIKGDTTDKSFLMFLLAGSAVFLFVRLLLQGAGFAVVEDREHYKTLRYVYISPVYFPVQIAGRVVIKLAVALVGMVVTFLAGSVFLNVSFRADGVLWGWFLGAMAIGLIGLLAISWILASMMLLVDRMGWIWAEGVSGVMLLMSGAVIPFHLLPAPFVLLGKFLPVTYWAELWRLALYGTETVRSLPDMSSAILWSRLWLTSGLSLIIAVVWYRVADYIARKWGRIERETFY